MIRPILIHPDPRLKKVVPAIASVDDSVKALAQDMLQTMYDAPGVGLAGPQIGAMKRIFVMDCADKDEEPKPLVFINPEIVWSSDERNAHEEGCLSIPEVYAEVIRPKMVRVQFLDENGAEREAEFDGLEATCVQHELDHLNGKLFIDYLGSVKRGMITNKMKKLKKARG